MSPFDENGLWDMAKLKQTDRRIVRRLQAGDIIRQTGGNKLKGIVLYVDKNDWAHCYFSNEDYKLEIACRDWKAKQLKQPGCEYFKSTEQYKLIFLEEAPKEWLTRTTTTEISKMRFARLLED